MAHGMPCACKILKWVKIFTNIVYDVVFLFVLNSCKFTVSNIYYNQRKKQYIHKILTCYELCLHSATDHTSHHMITGDLDLLCLVLFGEECPS